MNHRTGTVSCDILIRSYARDFEWLRYCLASIRRYARGFRQVVLVVPESSARRLRELGLSADVNLTCPDYAVDYLGQQVTKLHADLLSDADYICHVDSDCVFDKPLAPCDLFREGKLEFALTPYSELPPGRSWQAATERCLGFPVAHDFMRRQPHTYPRGLYAALRAHVASLHAVSLESYVLAQSPRGFSEFNALGAFAYAGRYETFAWTQVAANEPDRSLCRWFWSWGGITPEIEREIRAIL